MNKDQVNGRIKTIEGAVKELTGKLLGNATLKTKGRVEKTLGKMQASYGDLIASLNKST